MLIFIILVGLMGFSIGFTDDGRPKVVNFYSTECPYRTNEVFDQIASATQELYNLTDFMYSVDATHSPELALKYRLDGLPKIRFITNTEVIDEFTGRRTYDELLKYVLNRADYEIEVPTQQSTQILDRTTVDSILNMGENAMILLVESEVDESTRVFEAAAKVHAGDIIFAIAQQSNDPTLFKQLRSWVGGQDTPLPQVWLLSALSMQKFLYSDSLTPNGVDRFLRDFREGRLNRFLKSQPVPAPSSDAIRTLVGSNFHERAHDALLLLYIPGCPHTGRMRDLLFQAVNAHPQLNVYQVDVQNNDLPIPIPSNYPTIMFLRGNEQIPFQLTKTEQNILNFITEQLN